MTKYKATASGQVPLTAAEEADFDAMQAEALINAKKDATLLAEKQSKLTGIEILGVMCSATSKDQAGLTAVAVGAMRSKMAGQSFAPTNFTFENGTELVITPDNFAEIEAIWTPFRQSFFTP